MVTESAQNYLFAGYLIRLRPNQRVLSPSYLQRALSSHLLRSQIESKAKSTSGVNNINSGELKDLVIPVCNITEQHLLTERLDAILSSVDAAEEETRLDLLRTEKLRQAILQQAFSGRLFPQDPNDEPASVLLERIRAEKEKTITPEPNKRAKRATA